MQSPFRVARPQTERHKEEDLWSWKVLGLGLLGHRTLADDEQGRALSPRADSRLLCKGINKRGLPCTAWGCFQSPDGRRWCHAHRVHEAERR